MERTSPTSSRGLSNRARKQEARLQQREIAMQSKQAERRQLKFAGLVFICGVLVLFSAIFLTSHKDPASPTARASSSTPHVAAVSHEAAPTRTNPNYPTLEELFAMTPEQLAKVDIAVVNLRCAEGLPGAEKIDIAAALKKIDAMAARVKHETEVYSDYLSKHPERYGGVMGKYQMDMLTTVLQQDFGMHYDPAMIALLGKEGTEEDTFLDDARNVFVCGLTERQMGTCSSMPVLYAAVARRLGYPVYLAENGEHIYLKWIDDNVKFNIDATSEGGLSVHPDEYYRQWPHPVSAEDAEKYHFFKPLTARDELAMFLSMRAAVWMNSGNMAGAIICQMKAVEAAENNKAAMNRDLEMLRRERDVRQVEQANEMLDELDRMRELQSRPIRNFSNHE